MTPPVIEQPCKQCGKRFKQPRVRGRPWSYCSVACKHAARLTRCRVNKKTWYNQMREAGVPASVATTACTSKRCTEIVIQLAEEGAYR